MSIFHDFHPLPTTALDDAFSAFRDNPSHENLIRLVTTAADHRADYVTVTEGDSAEV